MKKCSLLLLFIEACHCGDSRYLGGARRMQGWNYINLHCRDNENKPVDWWYIYKPPSGSGPNMELGNNFSYISPDTTGRWRVSHTFIDVHSMLLHTLSPLYRPTYSDYLAVIAYSGQTDGNLQSSAYGLMMADEIGGVWMSHTVPGLLDMTGDRPTFPQEELETGHLFVCLSLDLATLNTVAASIGEAGPKVTRLRVPDYVRHVLPHWEHFARPVQRSTNSAPQSANFQTTYQTLSGLTMARRPGDKRCLYDTFAREKRIVLDVYGHDARRPPVCEKSFGVRNIDSVSLKYPDSVYYIDNRTDRASFAVSTAAAVWQTKGDGPRQFWACISTMGKGESIDRGGLIVCVENYDVWWSFDNLKVKEPRCPNQINQ